MVCGGDLVESLRRETDSDHYIDWKEHEVPRHLVAIDSMKKGQYPIVEMLRHIM